MTLILFPPASFYGSGGSSASSDGHSHSNINTLNKLSTDNNGKLCFNGIVVGEKSIETAYNITLKALDISRKYIQLPEDCDTSRIITLALNGVSLPQGDFWEVNENVNSSNIDFIAWNGLGLDGLIRAGDTFLISYYKII